MPSRQASHARLVARGWVSQHSQQSSRVVIAQSASTAHVTSPMVDGSGGSAPAEAVAEAALVGAEGSGALDGEAADADASPMVTVVGETSRGGGFVSWQLEATRSDAPSKLRLLTCFARSTPSLAASDCPDRFSGRGSKLATRA